ncbi:hypothetical protein [Shewanella sedimentimangrovi]|uniref:DUF4034 domain-containing protein n=1 Tax=Shewanella sedimentimangrovi TaxID=2814293 RepID=A0ABX7R1W9_9GAMM|nr:hypothetical protein [Shewanella sedimentimangrovi]QSX37812.1 hypothetical protein JYB85_02925 [Shewanella sedimentimangrovi]
MQLQIILARWLILVFSIVLSANAAAEQKIQCNPQTYQDMNDAIQLADSVAEVENIVAPCDTGIGSFPHELRRRVEHLYIRGGDPLLDKWKISSNVTLYRMTVDSRYFETLVAQAKKFEHAFIELCMFNLWAEREHCKETEFDVMINHKLPHAMWAKSNFHQDEQRISLLDESRKFGHVDALSEYLIAMIDENNPQVETLKSQLWELILSGNSIDAEIYYIRSIVFGFSPYKKNSRYAISLINELLKYRDYSELYYFNAIAYFDINEYENFKLFLEKAVNMGNEEAIYFLNGSKEDDVKGKPRTLQ